MSDATQLYLTLEIGAGSMAATEAALLAALSGGEIVSLLLRAQPGATLDAGTVKTLCGMAQKRGIAVMIEDDVKLARMIKADGLHLSWSKDVVSRYADARAHFGDHAMIGADAGRSRDDAMVLGERGADYIAFGIPAHVEDRATAENRQRDLIAWWSEIFEVPCVAMDVSSPDHARDLAQDGAEFVSVTVTTAMTADEIRKRVGTYADAVADAGAAA